MRRSILILVMLVSALGRPGASISTPLIPKVELSGLSWSASPAHFGVSMTRFRLSTEYGTIVGTLEERAAISRLTLTHPASGSTSVTTVSTPEPWSDAQLRFEYPTLGTDIRFREGAAGPVSEPVAYGTIDCARIAADPLTLGRDELLARWGAQAEQLAPAPEEALRLWAALSTSAALPALVPECGPVFQGAGGCYYDNSDYAGCLGCCDAAGELAAGACYAAAAVGCGSPFCGWLAKGGCKVVSAFSSSLCANHNCAGKPGSGGCGDPRPPCGGACMEFCGPGWSSACGDCPVGKQCCR